MNIRAWRPDVPLIGLSIFFSTWAVAAVCTANGVFGKAARTAFRVLFGY
jgi:hypothetical protein